LSYEERFPRLLRWLDVRPFAGDFRARAAVRFVPAGLAAFLTDFFAVFFTDFVTTFFFDDLAVAFFAAAGRVRVEGRGRAFGAATADCSSIGSEGDPAPAASGPAAAGNGGVGRGSKRSRAS
jgi:hypothetical protein